MIVLDHADQTETRVKTSFLDRKTLVLSIIYE